MTTGHPDPVATSGVETLTMGPTGRKRGWGRFRRPAVLTGVGVLALAVLGFVGFSIYGLVVGGAATAQGAAYAVVDDLNDRDLPGLYQLLDPHEREAYARAATGLSENARHLGLGGTPTPGGGGDQLSLAGIDLRLTGVRPTVQKLAPDVALLHYATGEVTASIRPAETGGLLRVGLDTAQIGEPVTWTKPVAELAGSDFGNPDESSGLGLIAVRSGLRWYISPAASAAWISRMSSEDQAADDITLTQSRSAGQSSAREAATATVTAALESTGEGDVRPLAATLLRSEQIAVEILTAEAPAEEAEPVDADATRIDEVRFSDGPRQGVLQSAYLEELDATIEDQRLYADSTCLTSGSFRACAADPSYQAPTPNFVRFFSPDGKLGVTAREARGGWKVSLADTLADGVVSWSAGLKRDQALSILGLAHLEPPGGSIGVGKTTVTYNDADYAVRTLTVPKPGRYVFAGPGDDYFDLEVHPATGGEEIEATFDGEIEPTFNGRSYRLVPGDYVVVLRSGGPQVAGRDRTGSVVVTRVPH